MLKLYFYSLILTCFCSLTAIAQVKVWGVITEQGTQEPIANVHILSDKQVNTFSDLNGVFQLELSPGEHTLSFQHLSYKLQSKNITLEANKPLQLNIELSPSNQELETVVLSAGKFEQQLEEISVSLDVLKGTYVENLHNFNVERSISQAPGIHIIDGQINIRGGSGWSYGAGSRVLVLLDGLPVTNASTGAVQWELIPAENIERIEIIKGASSVLFGSSALNGVINITSKQASNKPQTTLTAYHTYFDNARRASLNWGASHNINLEEYGVNFNHSQQYKNIRYNFGFQGHNSDGYQGLIDTNYTDTDTTINIHHLGNNRIRLYLNTLVKSNNIKGLSYGVNTSYLRFNESDGFMYLSDSLGYSPFSEENYSVFKSAQTSISPTLEYNNSNNNTKHKLLSRYLQTNFNPDGTQKLNNYVALYSEYLFQKFYLNGTWTSGTNLNYYVGLSDFFNSDKSGVNYSFFSQYDHTQGPLRFSLGTRYEQYTIRNKNEGKPVFRAGLNYELNENNFFRASFGQGYRYPSMYELFLYKDAGEISIYSNPELKPETGYTAEIGYKRKIQLNDNFKSYIDLALFQMSYNDMVEYSYGLWGDSTSRNPLGIGFMPINVGQTKISGVDFSILSEANFGKWNMYSRLSYTYSNPIAVNPDEIYANYNSRLGDLIQNYVDNGTIPEGLAPVLEQVAKSESELSYNSTSSNPDSETLKYRYRHMAKLDLEVSRAKWKIGTHLHYNSFMENIDKLFESGAFNAEVQDLFTLVDANIYDMGIKKSRKGLNSGDYIADVRISYIFAKYISTQFLIENIGNREYQIRPGSIGSPRVFSLKITAQF
jgi:iron complex outermembrane receptor protein